MQDPESVKIIETNPKSNRNMTSKTTDKNNKGSSSYMPSYLKEGSVCVVCGDVATGYHYKAMTCEGCKGFFRRSHHKDLIKTYRCRKSSNCPVNIVTRHECQYCRYQKCLTMKMRPEVVMSDQARSEKRRLVALNRQQRKLKLLTEASDPTENALNLTNSSSKIDKLLSVLNGVSTDSKSDSSTGVSEAFLISPTQSLDESTHSNNYLYCNSVSSFSLQSKENSAPKDNYCVSTGTDFKTIFPSQPASFVLVQPHQMNSEFSNNTHFSSEPQSGPAKLIYELANENRANKFPNSLSVNSQYQIKEDLHLLNTTCSKFVEEVLVSFTLRHEPLPNEVLHEFSLDSLTEKLTQFQLSAMLVKTDSVEMLQKTDLHSTCSKEYLDLRSSLMPLIACNYRFIKRISLFQTMAEEDQLTLLLSSFVESQLALMLRQIKKRFCLVSPLPNSTSHNASNLLLDNKSMFIMANHDLVLNNGTIINRTNLNQSGCHKLLYEKLYDIALDMDRLSFDEGSFALLLCQIILETDRHQVKNYELLRAHQTTCLIEFKNYLQDNNKSNQSMHSINDKLCSSESNSQFFDHWIDTLLIMNDIRFCAVKYPRSYLNHRMQRYVEKISSKVFDINKTGCSLLPANKPIKEVNLNPQNSQYDSRSVKIPRIIHSKKFKNACNLRNIKFPDNNNNCVNDLLRHINNLGSNSKDYRIVPRTNAFAQISSLLKNNS